MTNDSPINRMANNRRGAALVWMTALLVVVLTAAVFCVDIGRMMHVRSQLQRATDAGALAGAMQLRDTSDPALVTAKVIEFVQQNNAGWENQVLSGNINVTLGKWNATTHEFSPTSAGQTPNSVRVSADLPNEPFFFAPIFDRDSFALTRQATATLRAKPYDVMMVLDFSGSMSSDGRIQALRAAAPEFVDTVRRAGDFHQIGVMGYGVRPDDFDPGSHGSGTPYTSAPPALYPSDSSWVGVLEGDLTFNLTSVIDGPLSSSNIESAKYGGGTPIGAALRDGAHNVIYSAAARSTSVAAKAIVLMSDGHANKPEGDDDDDDDAEDYAIQMANYAAGMGIEIYTISLGDDADVDLMTNIAAIGGGKHFLADGSGTSLLEKLTRAFRNTAIAINTSTLVE